MSIDMYNKVTHCIFDMDGLLLEYLYTKAYNRITNRFGKEFTWEHKVYTMGFNTKNIAEYIVKTLELPLTTDEFEQEIGIYQELFPYTNSMLTLYIKTLSRSLLKHLKENNVPIALATGSNQENYELKTKWHDLFELFHYKVIDGSDPEVAHGKPESDIAAKCFLDNPDPSKVTLVFEDSPSDVKAAFNAEVQVIMYLTLPKRYTSETTLVLDSLENFQPEKFGLPSYVT